MRTKQQHIPGPAIVDIFPGDTLRLPSGRLARFVRWAVDFNAHVDADDERVGEVQIKGVGAYDTVRFSERLLRMAEKVKL